MTENSANPSRGDGRQPRRRPGILGPWALVALLAAALVAALIIGISGLGPGSRWAAAAPSATSSATPAAAPTEAPQDVVFRTEAPDAVGDGAFLPAAAGPAVLDGPGSPGTGELGACDPARLISFLADHPDAAAAWVHALDADPTLRWAGGSQVTVDQIPDYVRSLSATKLEADTRVTNYFFTAGEAVPFQSLLVSGTAVLVDADGTPRVRCACGNPLNPPIRISTPPVYTPCDRTPQGCTPPCDWDNDHYGCAPPCYWDDRHSNCTPPCYWDDRHDNCTPPCNWHHPGCVPPCDWDPDRHNCRPHCDLDDRLCRRPPVCLTGTVDCRPDHPVQCENRLPCTSLGGSPPQPTSPPVQPTPTRHPVRCLPEDCRSLPGSTAEGGSQNGGHIRGTFPGRLDNRPARQLANSAGDSTGSPTVREYSPSVGRRLEAPTGRGAEHLKR